MATHHLIVDGYNVIRQTQPYLDIVERDDWDSAREALIADVAASLKPHHHATVVFDGTANPLSAGVPERRHGVVIIFSPHGLTADSVIERLARESREHAELVEVVTSDAQTQWAVLGARVVRRSSREFGELLEAEAAERADALTARGQARKSTVLERVSPEARAALEALRLSGRPGKAGGGKRPGAGEGSARGGQ